MIDQPEKMPQPGELWIWNDQRIELMLSIDNTTICYFSVDFLRKQHKIDRYGYAGVKFDIAHGRYRKISK